MIELYAAGTGNGQRAAMALEEAGLPYVLRPVDLEKGEQRSPDFLARNPMGQIPMIVDPEGPGGKPLTLSQSSAILLYAAEKSGRLLPADPVGRWMAIEWMQNACTDISCASSAVKQVSGWTGEQAPALLGHFENALLAFLRVCEGQLAGRDYLAGGMTVADVALYPTTLGRRALIERVGDLPNLRRWMARMAARPAIVRAMTLWA